MDKPGPTSGARVARAVERLWGIDGKRRRHVRLTHRASTVYPQCIHRFTHRLPDGLPSGSPAPSVRQGGRPPADQQGATIITAIGYMRRRIIRRRCAGPAHAIVDFSRLRAAIELARAAATLCGAVWCKALAAWPGHQVLEGGGQADELGAISALGPPQ